ncbi:zinc transporter ttm-1 isoform X1 [Calliphora vicina]|uniref:zinc transporter ttm-1 isoform X1 n=1 Tax=Calliphora vicina TaxID=7373 RepID=UPI00325BAC7C
MSKYHILNNSDFLNHDDDDSTATSTSTITAAPLTDDEENFGLFGRSHHHRPNDQLKQKNSVHQNKQHQYLNNYYDNDHDDHDDNRYSHDHRELLISDNHVEDLIQYTNNNNTIDNNNQSIYNNSSNTTTAAGKHQFTNTNNLMTPLDSAAADDDYTMDVPLLQQNYNNNNTNNNNNNNGDRRNNYNKKQQQEYDFECVCLCQQKGFASNLNSNSTKSAKSKILWAIALCCIFMVVEFLGGYLAGSLAIMTDAAHLASDCISFVIGLVAIWLGNKPPDGKMSFGYKRFEVMGAIVSILGIWILTATLVLVAIQRIYSNDYDLDANTMMTISGIGILINIIMIFILHTSVLDLPAGSIGSSHGHSHNHNDHHGHSHSHSHSPTLRQRHSNDSGHLHTEFATRSLLPTDSDADAAATDAIDTGGATSIELSSAPMVLNGNLLKHQQDGNEKNLNLRAAMIHVIGDLVQSFGVFFASVLIKIFPKAVFLDPLCTLLFSIIVVMTTINLFKESIHLIMDSVPQDLSIDDLEMDLLNIEGVKSVHHLNVWNHTSNYSILMVHLVIDILTDSNTVLMNATQLAGSAKYNIKHSTIQIERVTS